MPRKEPHEITYEKILEYAAQFNGNIPPVHFLREKLGYTRFTIYVHLNRLILEGKLDRRDGILVILGAEWKPPDRRRRHWHFD